ESKLYVNYIEDFPNSVNFGHEPSYMIQTRHELEETTYMVEWEEDNKHIKEVRNPRLIETGYRSPQLTLWTLGPDEWLLFLKLPDYAMRKKPKGAPVVIQLPLPAIDPDSQPDSISRAEGR
ncbi:MAG TPA: hypothetical protein VGN34_27395, partial [Ktedonobacteraceae bacterium]